MKRKILEYVIALGVMAAVALGVMLLLGRFANPDPVVGQVIIKNSHGQITPVSGEIYVTRDKTVTEKKRLVPEEILADLPRLQLDNSLMISYEGGSENGNFFYTFYKENMEIFSEKQSSFKVPDQPGEYIVCMELYWGTPRENIGMEYYFILEVPEDMAVDTAA